MARKGIRLIAPDNNGILCYQGGCKLKVNTLSEILKIEPKNQEFNDISALFQWKFIKKKNLLFVFAESRIQDFVLIFANEETCKTVYDAIYKNREVDFVDKEELEQRLLIPVFQLISETVFTTRFKRFMLEWIEKHEENEKKELLKLLKEQKRNYQILDVKNIKQESKKNLINPRKRRFSEMRNYNSAGANEEEYIESVDSNFNNFKAECDEMQFLRERMAVSKFTKIIDELLFKIVNVKHQSGFYRKLLIFTSAERTKCFEYKFYPSKQIFYHRCNSNPNGIKAILKMDDENGNECIELEDKPHVCSPLKYDPENYFEIKIVKKPDYEIIENSGTKSKRMLIIFNPNDRKLCYEYYWHSNKNKFICCGCCNLVRKNILAEICHENTEKEYIRLINDQHICEIRNYNPEKFNQFYKYVLSPDYEIQTKIKNGIERKTLIIFDESNRKLCYTYFFRTSTNVFYCSGCNLKDKTVSARLSQNDDGVEYAILSNAEHVCSLRTYIPQQIEIILRSPKFKFIEATEKNTSKLIFFVPNNNQLCYTFSPYSGENKFNCLGCLQIANRKKKLPSGNACETKRIVSVYLCKNDSPNGDGEYYVKMNINQKHICEPRKYEPEKFKIKILKPKDEYILIENKKNGLPDLIIYDQNDKNLCFKYYYDKSSKIFRCRACEMKKTRVTAELHRNSSNGNEYIVLNQKKHVCSPIKISTIIKSNTVILEKNDLFLKETKSQIKEFDESRLPNFELQPNKFGVPDRKLIIFKKDDKELCYEFGYKKALFECNKCKITAKLHHDSENGEKYVILNKIEHKCEPVKYVPDLKIIKAPDFMIFNRGDDSKITKLIIFASKTKELCYQYSFSKDGKCFRCCGCWTLKKVSAKLSKDSNGNEYVQLLTNNHVCKPKKFVLEQFQPMTVPESGFKLCSNKNGKPNSKLILFDQKKDGFCYEYYLDRNLFICNQCKNNKKHVTAKLCEKENGEKYLELSAEKHICKSSKYDPESYKENEKKTVFDNFVVQHNISGDPNSRLTIFDKNDKYFGYQYSFRKSQNAFFCNECNKRSKQISAKLLIDANGIEAVEFGMQEHVCEIQNFKEKNIIFEHCKFEENGNTLIANHLIQNGKNYKFKFDNQISAYCCIKCKEKKKIITATVCNGKDGKEFRLLNDIHCCIALSK